MGKCRNGGRTAGTIGCEAMVRLRCKYSTKCGKHASRDRAASGSSSRASCTEGKHEKMGDAAHHHWFSHWRSYSVVWMCVLYNDASLLAKVSLVPARVGYHAGGWNVSIRNLIGTCQRASLAHKARDVGDYSASSWQRGTIRLQPASMLAMC